MTDTKLPAASDDDDLTRALGVVTQLLRERERASGADIGHALKREIPGFSVRQLGYPSLTRLLLEAADDVVAVEKKGIDLVWALGESISDRDLEYALGVETEPRQVAVADSFVTWAQFINFRSCRNVKLDLAESGLTVLVGPNGSGKSTLLHGISYASQVTRGKPRALFSGPRDVRRLRSSNATTPMELAIGAANGITLRLSADPIEDSETQFTVALAWGNKIQQWTSPGKPPSPPLPNRPECRPFWPSILLRFRAEALATPAEVVEGQPRLSFDGTGLPMLLMYLANNEPQRLREVVDGVRQIVPAVEETRQVLRDSDHRDAVKMPRVHLEVKMRGAGWVPADLLSEGTLFAFGIQAIMHQPNPPRILLMDDIDRGLHPKAQRELIKQLKHIPENGGPRLIISTHSPYILDEIPAESVRVIRSDGSGTRLRALTDHPEWQEWKSSMTSGEFWGYVGEDWLENSNE